MYHYGNMLKDSVYTYITDLGLCRPVNVKSSQNEYEKQVYGVLPYMSPEILRGGEYTQKSDIYGFGIIAYEVYPSKRPKTKKLYNLLNDLYVRKHYGEINKQIEEADKINEKLTSGLSNFTV
ncbi:kinase-like domain-containing protein [Rhizophagus irregularis DAOM 181602=DAOM 197198]|uniref:Protein kinase domain-containing protein n=1 Tax=Rhizophagus irregularis (strain DAOM 181602 / DAOM 197198 / MUCL 43194) TaxID=747089 RepID=A0A2P4P2N6_RHIID|nr:hypothetical protein GLOIN_2v1788883 [Rhizophagus irregularis DAOM 181602=DAOM 197198]POG59647.1 hypothetical protein GLOIN_2v1788883 [Rhizophagus irregularis DAOM 181602=DAOM 197198]GBC18498.2 kinase-like domain-containing protein [Rhizophagus irregularis DAOM 181602=DAOM 197198]|eukprot:XP_025166513.1 hypothetical protein GLOIN_2v1788883 [Rhizophagus irregularis DAOM 181602=DAOM 197198]